MEIKNGRLLRRIFQLINPTKDICVRLKTEQREWQNRALSPLGISRPETGSTGDGFKWLKKLGHKIIDNDFALCAHRAKDEWAKTKRVDVGKY